MNYPVFFSVRESRLDCESPNYTEFDGNISYEISVPKYQTTKLAII
jgi:hypothetical protein